MCKLQEPPVKQLKMSDPTVEITVSQSAELSQALDEIFGLTQDGSSKGQKFQKANDKMEKVEKRLTGEQQANIEALNKKEERPTPDFSHGWGLQEKSPKQLEFLESQKQKSKEKRKKAYEVRKQKKADEKARLEKVLYTEREDRPYSREQLLALEQTRGFSYTPEVPSHELIQGPTQAGFVEVLPSYEEMTVDELFNGPSSMETQPDLEQV